MPFILGRGPRIQRKLHPSGILPTTGGNEKGLGGAPERMSFYVAAPTARVVYWFTGQDNEPAATLHGLPDEDQLLFRGINIPPTISQWLQPWSVDSSSISLLGLLDENELWINPNKPLLQPF